MTTIPKEAIKAAAKALRDFLNPEYGVYPVEQPTTAEYMHEAEVALAAALPHLQGWIPVEERLPEARYGADDQPPCISEDVAVYFEGSGADIANYDHEAKHWSLP